jgi:hypothetical protein
MDSAELLEQLADIHLPGDISFWPPALGWWILAILIIAAAVWSIILLMRKTRQRRICAYALKELEDIYLNYQASPRATEETENSANLLFVNEFNAVVRRVALWHYPNNGIASLSGLAWVDFIREKGDSSAMTEEIADVIRHGRFMPSCQVDINQLQQFGQQWISSLYMKYANAADSPKLST